MQRLAAFALAAACAATAAQAQTWAYKSYPRDRLTGQPSKERFVRTTVTVEEKDGQASFLMIYPGKGDPCTSNVKLPARVERGSDTTTVLVQPELQGCEPFRYVIRNDGSGGVRQHRRQGEWVDDGLDHDLTPAR